MSFNTSQIFFRPFFPLPPLHMLPFLSYRIKETLYKAMKLPQQANIQDFPEEGDGGILSYRVFRKSSKLSTQCENTVTPIGW